VPAASYRRTADKCGSRLLQLDGRLITWYCNGRSCWVCGAIRTARAWVAYGPTVREWVEAGQGWLVTLTAPNVRGRALRGEIRRLTRVCGDAWRSGQRKRTQWATQAIRALEVTYSEKRDDYHPHLHLIVRGEAAARGLVAAWLKRNPDASPRAQDVRRADRHSTAELFKYATKLASDIRNDDGTRRVIPATALHQIYSALRGLRVWQPMGVESAVQVVDADEEVELEQGTAAPDARNNGAAWQWLQVLRDWVNEETCEALSGHQAGHLDAVIDSLEARADAAEETAAQRRRESPASPPPAATACAASPASGDAPATAARERHAQSDQRSAHECGPHDHRPASARRETLAPPPHGAPSRRRGRSRAVHSSDGQLAPLDLPRRVFD
jgi:hypothetical protein